MKVEFSGDEIILALVSLVRAINPAMLGKGADGFTVDFESIDPKRKLTADEQLLLKLRVALEGRTPTTVHVLELDASEGKRLGEALERLESLQQWPADVLELSRRLRPRLIAVE